MFRKIVSNLPFHPGLMHQLTFYAKRLHQEESLRRTGMIFAILALMVQFFMFVSPAETTLATSTSNIIYGATTKQQVLSALASGQDTKGRTDIRQIFDYYGITATDVESAVSTTVRSRERSYITTGRNDSPGIDTPVQIPGSGSTIYERSLNVWDGPNSETYYPAIQGTATGEGLLKGRTFWILLKGCGNITFEPIPQNPNLEISKTLVGASTLKVGESLNYRINFRNSGNGPASNISITDTISPEYEFVSQTSTIPLAFSSSGNNLLWTLSYLEPSANWQYITLNLRIKPISEATKRVCNAAGISADGISTIVSADSESLRCINVDNTCPGSGLPAPGGDFNKCTVTCPDGEVLPYDQVSSCKTPIGTCDYLKITDRSTWNKRTFESKLSLSKGATLTNVELVVNGKVVKDFGTITTTSTLSHTGEFPAGTMTAKIVATPKSGTDYKSAASCQVSDELIQPYTRFSYKKGVSNITQKIENADKTTAKSGDELEYSLSVSNSGNVDATNFVMDSDDLSDILEYADFTSSEGATFDKTTQRLTWPATTVPANGTVVKKFSVKVKNPIPTTPPSLSDPHSFDYKLRNIFGNEVVVNLNKPIAGATYQTVSQLPNTGPGTSILVSLIAVAIIGYFYARSRLLSKEVAIIRTEMSAGV